MAEKNQKRSGTKITTFFSKAPRKDGKYFVYDISTDLDSFTEYTR